MSFLLGLLFNPIGVPGFVRAGDNKDGDTNVSVQFLGLWTIIRIDGSDIYFRLVIGTFDGITVQLPMDKEVSAPQLARPCALSGTFPIQSRTGIP
jgi:hypothetical protein